MGPYCAKSPDRVKTTEVWGKLIAEGYGSRQLITYVQTLVEADEARLDTCLRISITFSPRHAITEKKAAAAMP